MAQAVIISAQREGYSIKQVRRTLTVKELIAELEQYDEDAPVYLSHDNGYTYGGIGRYDFEEVWDDEQED